MLVLLALYSALVAVPVTFAAAASYSATYLPYNAPTKSEQGQTGTNVCGSGSSNTSMCQNAYMNGLDDFCLWAPPSTHSIYGSSAIGNTERIEVAWCLRNGYGTRLIPDGAITGAHWVQTPDYVQITGWGDLTRLNIPKGDDGGELDPHGADGNGNPIGGLVFGSSYNGTLRQYHEWTNFMSSNAFCFRACLDGRSATKYCGHIYDTLGCGWNMPGNYATGFSTCVGDSTEPMGEYVSTITSIVVSGTKTITKTILSTSTFYQGDPVTPGAHTAAPSSQCSSATRLQNIGSPAPTATASLLPASMSMSLSAASTASVASQSSTSNIATHASSTIASGSANGGATASSSGSSGVASSNAASLTRATGARGWCMAGITAVIGAGLGVFITGFI